MKLPESLKSASLILFSIVLLLPCSLVAAERVWVDFDPACGVRKAADVDDCLALVPLLRAADYHVVGISTTYGNAKIEQTHETALRLASVLNAQGISVPTIYRGAESNSRKSEEVQLALRDALAVGELTIIALGPLTNIAFLIAEYPELRTNISRLVVVMGKQPGQLFHPSEGSTEGIFGHGPIFSDMNFKKDTMAAEFLFQSGIDITLIAYELGRQAIITATDIDLLADSSEVGRWLADRSQDWLYYWSRFVGREGFYPFDLMAVAYLLEPELMHCPEREAVIAPDRSLGIAGGGPKSLMVLPPGQETAANRTVKYCDQLVVSKHWKPVSYLLSI
ncbi:MAG: nucleoside hydrolase [Pseudomonadales bacterium]|nr:nucleoside hydrolase [Pseudomonadales bacterium]